MKLLLCAFEQLSGLKINFHKSEMFCFGEARDLGREYSQIFGCDMGALPFRYLGIPMHHRKLRNSEWKEVEERFQKKLSGWKGKMLSVSGRLVLINSVLSNFSMFMLSFFEVPRGVLKRLDYYRSRFFWQSDGHKKKYRLIKWGVLCTPKDQGGLGILDLDLQNRCLLSKWVFRLINEDGIWQRLLRNKYLRHKTITQVEYMPGDSHFWSSLMKVKNDFLRMGKFMVGDGSQTRFWEDAWLETIPFKLQYPDLYNIVRKKSATVSTVLRSNPLNVAFRRSLVGNNLQAWLHLIAKVVNVQLTDQKDTFLWTLKQNSQFTVRSMYRALVAPLAVPYNNIIWKLKIPLKIKVFMWYLQKGVVLTKDNLARRQWKGSIKCCFCNFDETIQHLFFDCQLARIIWRIVHVSFNITPPMNILHMFNGWLIGLNKKLMYKILVGASAVCWAIWLSRNDMVFNNSRAATPLQVIFRGTHWIRLWALLQKENERPQVTLGCRVLKTTAMEFFASNGWSFSYRISNG